MGANGASETFCQGNHAWLSKHVEGFHAMEPQNIASSVKAFESHTDLVALLYFQHRAAYHNWFPDATPANFSRPTPTNLKQSIRKSNTKQATATDRDDEQRAERRTLASPAEDAAPGLSGSFPEDGAVVGEGDLDPPRERLPGGPAGVIGEQDGGYHAIKAACRAGAGDRASRRRSSSTSTLSAAAWTPLAGSSSPAYSAIAVGRRYCYCYCSGSEEEEGRVKISCGDRPARIELAIPVICGPACHVSCSQWSCVFADVEYSTQPIFSRESSWWNFVGYGIESPWWGPAGRGLGCCSPTNASIHRGHDEPVHVAP
ncbi:hypothetical protein NL676_005536 [Syzygium grande]|nr:hypothetical protein NL676_005536 [Syzygium grande]